MKKLNQRKMAEYHKNRKWIIEQQEAYKKGKLSKSQIRKLESINGWQWETGYIGGVKIWDFFYKKNTKEK